MFFTVGDRGQVSDSHHWAQGATGAIVVPPEPVRELATGWQGPRRSVDGRNKSFTFYWVEFDEPQIDQDGDGPYNAREIDQDYLRSIVPLADSD